MSCFDARRCKAVGANGTLLYTKNAGATWRSQANPLAGSGAVLYRIVCRAPATCYVIGRPNTLLVTHNGGVTWTVHRIQLAGLGPELVDTSCVVGQEGDLRGRPALCRLGLLDMACLTVNVCYVVGTIRVSGGEGLGPVMYLTSNGGSTWTKQQIPITARCEGVCASHRVPYPLEWISCANASKCWAGGWIFMDSHAGAATLIIKMTKPGAPWKAVNDFEESTANSAVCPSARRCYGVWTTDPFDLPGNGIYVFPVDGSLSTNRLSSGSPRMRNAIACPGIKTCYSVGNQGTITATTNGLRFFAQRSPTSHDLYGVRCVGLTTCFAVGNKGTIVART